MVAYGGLSKGGLNNYNYQYCESFKILDVPEALDANHNIGNDIKKHEICPHSSARNLDRGNQATPKTISNSMNVRVSPSRALVNVSEMCT